MLYKISEDKIEACALNDPAEVAVLKDIVIAKAPEYNQPTVAYELDLRSLRAQLLSYDCVTECVYTEPWDDTFNPANINGIWSSFIDLYEECHNLSSSAMEEPVQIEEPIPEIHEPVKPVEKHSNEYYDYIMKIGEDYKLILAMGVGSLISMVLIILSVRVCNKRTGTKDKKALHQIIENDDESDAEIINNQNIMNEDEEDKLL